MATTPQSLRHDRRSTTITPQSPCFDRYDTADTIRLLRRNRLNTTTTAQSLIHSERDVSSSVRPERHASRPAFESSGMQAKGHAARTSCGPNVTRLNQHVNQTTCGLVRKWRNGARLQKMTTLLAENARRGPRHLRTELDLRAGARYDLRFCDDATHRERPIAPFATNIGLQSGPLVAFSDTRAQ